MTVEQIRRAQEARPFRPFVLRTGGGQEYAVPHPEFLWILPPGRTVCVACEDGSAEFLDLLLVESLHFGSEHRPAGRRRRAS